MKSYHLLLTTFYLLSSLLLLHHQILANDFKGFDDTVLFNLVWPGKDEILPNFTDEELIVTTMNKEKYKCIIPSITKSETTEDIVYTGPTPLDLLIPLFSTTSCSYRIESYWTYEICHGNYIKQYHEEREGKSMKIQEFYLGKWDKQATNELKLRLEKSENENERLKYKKIDGLNLPYLELEMKDGTLCDLNNENRVTRVLYVCYTHGKNEIYSLKETSTCNYEVIILTPTLCTHPKYKPQDLDENKIKCFAQGNAPKKPKALLAMEVEGMKLRYQKLSEVHKSVKEAIAVIKLDQKEGQFKMEILENNLLDNFEKKSITSSEQLKDDHDTSPSTSQFRSVKNSRDTKPVRDFLSGKTCLTGGSGWWKFELCYGKHVRQYHGDTSIYLGYFDEEKHNEYLTVKNPSILRTSKHRNDILVNYYSDGDICDKTQQPRHVEVKLKCVESESESAVALYLLEPKQCEYVLHVESSLICDIIPQANKMMIVPKDSLYGSSSNDEDTNTLYILSNDVNN
uniref:Endoplasmic reticulum lectin 1 n=1 Tax=Corethrella appendiculata TaxID=1370023 RepID=U5EP20_9DIPT